MLENEVKRIKVSARSELAASLRAAKANGEALIIDTGEAEYPIYVGTQAGAGGRSREEGEAERSKDAIRRAAGSWRDIDADALKRYLAERRRAANRPPVRW